MIEKQLSIKVAKCFQIFKKASFFFLSPLHIRVAQPLGRSGRAAHQLHDT